MSKFQFYKMMLFNNNNFRFEKKVKYDFDL